MTAANELSYAIAGSRKPFVSPPPRVWLQGGTPDGLLGLSGSNIDSFWRTTRVKDLGHPGEPLSVRQAPTCAVE